MIVRCRFCDMPVDPHGGYAYRKVTGWERKAHDPSRRGGSDIVLREPQDVWACGACVDRLRLGLSASQGTLL